MSTLTHDEMTRLTEIQWFRLLLIAVTAFIVGGGSVWAVSTSSAASASERSRLAGEKNLAALDKCFVEDHDSTIEQCERKSYDMQWFTMVGDDYRKTVDAYEGRADLALLLAWVPPLVLVTLFYAVRWALSGRVRPFWLLRR
jgi:hypothetical protein